MSRSSHVFQDCYGNGGREQEGTDFAIARQALQVYLDPRSTVSEGQGRGNIDWAIGGEERIDRR